MVDAAQVARVKRADLLERLMGCFARWEPAEQAGKYIDGLTADLPRKNGWTLAEQDSGKVYADWPAARPTLWRTQIRIAAPDPFRGYLNALREHLPAATHVLDAFHITARGMKAVDEVRRRVQQTTLGQQGHKGDPLYEIRRLLRHRADRLTTDALARLTAGLAAGDPDGELTTAWWATQQLCLAYAIKDIDTNTDDDAIDINRGEQPRPPAGARQTHRYCPYPQ